MTTKIEVGSFTFDRETSQISGPADYMSERFSERLAEIEAGRCTVFNYGAAHIGEPGFAESIEVALLVAIQTDYAGWHGSKVFFARADAGLVPETGLPV